MHPHLGRRAAAALLVAAGALAPSPAAANGAFPDSMGIFVPDGQPGRIVLGTNFGVLMTDDRGQTPWRWICEPAISTFPFYYQVGPAPSHTLYAVDLDGIHRSEDDGCTFTVGTAPSRPEPNDVFPDPTDAARVFMLGRPTTTATDAWGLYVSQDNGATYGDAALLTAPNEVLESVEVARSAPERVYATKSAIRTGRRYLLRSSDGGRSFETLDVTPQIGTRIPRIAAVHPTDPNTLYFRLVRTSSRDAEALGISEDGGQTLRIAFPADARMTAFLRRSDGALLVATLTGTFISRDGGRTFVLWPNAPHIRALAERDGAVYAAADDLVDGFAVASTTDDGAHWTPLLRFSEIGGPLDCPAVRAACDGPWNDLAARLMLSPGGPDGGAPDAGAGAADAGLDAAGAGPSCGSVAGGGPPIFGALGVCALLGLAALRWRRRGPPG